MAKSNLKRVHEPDTRPKAPVLRLVETDIKTDFEAEPGKPVRGIHPQAIGLAALGVVVFLLASTQFLSGDPGSDLNIYGIAGFAVIFFTLTLGLAWHIGRDPRWGGPSRSSLRAFADDNVAIATGTISGHEALIQILVLPATLALGMVVLGLIFAFGF